MASRLTIAQTHLAEADTALAALDAQTATYTAAESTATQEQVEAHIQAVTAARTTLAAAQREVATAQRLVDLDVGARATTTVHQPAATGPILVTPRAEQDPRRGFTSVGHLAQSVKAFQDSRTNGIPMDTRTNELIGILLNDTAQFSAAEQAEVSRLRAMGYQVAAPTPLHQEGNSSDGLMVPVDYRNDIWKPAYEQDDLLTLFNPQPTSSRVVQFAADETTPWGAAGIKAYWLAEGAQKTPSKLLLSPREVHIHKIAALVYSTDELLQDAALLTARINEAAPRAIAWEVVEAFIRGTGSGRPLGYEAAIYAGDIVVSKETNQKAKTIYTENVLNMASRINEGPGSRLMWLAHRSTIPQIATLKIGNEPSWTNQNQGLREAPNGMLLGVPVKFSQHARTLGAQGDLTLIDFAGYASFVHSSGTRFDSSIHLYFDYDITAFRWVMRVGGMPYLSAPVTPADTNADTMSHFIQLAVRA